MVVCGIGPVRNGVVFRRGRYREGGMSYHEGDPPDSRMTAAALNRGVKLGGGARSLTPDDLETFDLIVGMVSKVAREDIR